MPAAKPTPLEELATASAQGRLTPEETARRYHAITGYMIQETVPNPRALMLLSGTNRPAKARAKLARYFRFGILVVDQLAAAKQYKDPTETRDFPLLIQVFTHRRKPSPSEIEQFFNAGSFTGFALLQWTLTLAEMRTALRKYANTQSGFQKSPLTLETHASETPNPRQ